MSDSSSQSQPVSSLLGEDCKGRRLAMCAVGDGSGGVEFERLVTHLSRAQNFRVFPGERWAFLTPEERAAEINKGIEQSDAVRSSFAPVSSRPKVNVREYLDRLADGPKGQDGPVSSPGMNPETPTSTLWRK
jgi:hypothetical protein